MYDVVIIGAGVVGGVIARELSRYSLSACILEKENDVAMGATKANTAIVHAGFDAKEGSKKAEMNVLGSEMMEELCKELGVKFKRNGSLVIAFDKEDEETLAMLLKRGNTNGVKGLRIIDKAELKEMEPNVSDNATSALYAPTGAIISPYELAIAAVGNAMDNGVSLKRGFEVLNIEKTEGGYTVFGENESVEARVVINAAGVFSDKIAKMVGDDSFEITPRRGEYVLLDRGLVGVASHTIFRTPSKMGKGIVVTPTVHGNILLGPTSEDITEKEDKSTTANGILTVMTETAKEMNQIPKGARITSFCGIRAVGSTGDFTINSPKENFINVAAIESPGLTSSPAIAKEVAKMVGKIIPLNEKGDFNPVRKSMSWFADASLEEKNAAIRNNGAYGKIVCRCERISEGEIVEALNTEPRPLDLDGVKRRTRSQMGRCQGGFCSPSIMKLISKELNIPITEITKKGKGSEIVMGRTKE